MGADDMKARTPAPEGEAVAWRTRYKPGGSAALWTVSTADPRPSWPPAVVVNYEVQPLYASPVVPVGVRQRVLDELDKAWLHGQRRTSWRRDESADAILAALRFTDTGWRDIATAPVNERIMVWVTGKMMPGARFGSAYRGANGKVIAKPEGGNGDWTKEVTHWMPLPPAPTDTGRA